MKMIDFCIALCLVTLFTVACSAQGPKPFVIYQSTPPQWTQEERDRGFVVCTDHWQRPMYDVFVPTRRHLPEALSLTAARGEYESIQVGVYTLDNLQGLELTVDLDLPVTAYRFVPIDWEQTVASRVDGRTVKDKQAVKMPYFLYPKPMHAKAEKGKTYGFWLTVEVPEDAEPGKHEGGVTITAGGGQEVTLPMTVDVRPFVLPDPKIAFGMYFDPDGRINPAYTDPRFEKMYYADMAAHGMNSVTIYDDTHKILNRDGTWNEDILVEKIDMMKEVGLVDGRQPLFLITGYWEGIALENPDAVASIVERLEAIRARHGLPEIMMYGYDEPNPPFEPQIVPMKPWIDAGTKFITAMHKPEAVRALSPYYAVCEIESRTTDAALVETLRDNGCEFWSYDCNHHGFTPIYARTYAGLWSWNAGVKGNFIWAYTHAHWDPKDHYTIEDGEIKLHVLRWYARAAPGPDGPLPSIGWEARREGVDDYRYLQLVDELASRPDADPAAVIAARAWFEELREAVPWEELGRRLKYYAPDNGDFDAYDNMHAYREMDIEDYDALRARAAELIRRLGPVAETAP